MSIESDRERYLAALHGMQTGVEYVMRFDDESSPKHLRVGINSCQVNDAALVRLLIAKGIFTEEEYYKQLADEAERERDRYQEVLRKHYNSKITLH